jgi:hypothetical protein
MIESVQVGFEELRTRDHLFSPEIEDDPWILYHAISSPAERVIDKEGFGGVPSVAAPEHVIQMASLNSRMNWGGIQQGGFAVLNSLTRGRINYGPQTWFRENRMRALIYAQRSWVGGEWVRSFRYAFDDLVEFCSCEAVRQEHFQSQLDQCKQW